MVTCDKQEKVSSSQNELMWFFFLNKIFNLKVCWTKPFISGIGPNPVEHRAWTGQPHCLLQPYSCAPDTKAVKALLYLKYWRFEANSDSWLETEIFSPSNISLAAPSRHLGSLCVLWHSESESESLKEDYLPQPSSSGPNLLLPPESIIFGSFWPLI